MDSEYLDEISEANPKTASSAVQQKSRAMSPLTQRVLVSVVLLPIGIAAIFMGGYVFAGLVALIIALASWEYVRLFRTGGYQPSGYLVIAGCLLLVLSRAVNGFDLAGILLSGLILAAMVVHMSAFERGRTLAAADFAVTLGGILYLGWIGAYFISIRDLPQGEWWVMVALPSVWVADSGAYFIGRRWGRRKLSPRLSPKKTWEGYWGGVFFGTAGGALFAFLWTFLGSPVTPFQGGTLGLILALLTTFGDLGESMFKRQVGAKDSGRLLPGHGGVFDRIDSWLWAAVIGYYIVQTFWV